MLRKLYDWRDLQNCTITTKLLYEQQEGVTGFPPVGLGG
jgi:hypothetical protein